MMQSISRRCQILIYTRPERPVHPLLLAKRASLQALHQVMSLGIVLLACALLLAKAAGLQAMHEVTSLCMVLIACGLGPRPCLSVPNHTEGACMLMAPSAAAWHLPISQQDYAEMELPPHHPWVRDKQCCWDQSAQSTHDCALSRTWISTLLRSQSGGLEA